MDPVAQLGGVAVELPEVPIDPGDNIGAGVAATCAPWPDAATAGDQFDVNPVGVEPGRCICEDLKKERDLLVIVFAPCPLCEIKRLVSGGECAGVGVCRVHRDQYATRFTWFATRAARNLSGAQKKGPTPVRAGPFVVGRVQPAWKSRCALRSR